MFARLSVKGCSGFARWLASSEGRLGEIRVYRPASVDDCLTSEDWGVMMMMRFYCDCDPRVLFFLLPLWAMDCGSDLIGFYSAFSNFLIVSFLVAASKGFDPGFWILRSYFV